MESLPINFGNLSALNIAKAWNDFFDAARTLRERLGTRAHLADEYIIMMLEAANAITSEEIAADGFSAGSELYGLVQSIFNGSGEYQDHPFYETAAAYVEAHPLPAMDRVAKAWLYFIPLFGEYLEYAMAAYAETVRERAELAANCELREQIIRSLDGDDDSLLDTMALRLRECFAFSSMLSVFLNGAQYQLVEALSYFDKSTANHVLRLLLDFPRFKTEHNDKLFAETDFPAFCD